MSDGNPIHAWTITQVRIMQVFAPPMALGFCMLFGRIIRRLRSAPVRDEFRSCRIAT